MKDNLTPKDVIRMSLTEFNEYFGFIPDDYMGQPATYNFPATCIRKDP